MANQKGSRYILGHLSYSEIAGIKDGEEAVVVLNPLEPKARYEVSKNVKGAFSRVGRSCVVSTQMILMQSEPGTFKEGRILTITANGNAAPIQPHEDEPSVDCPAAGEVSAPASLDTCLATAAILQDQIHKLFVGANPFLGELIAPELEKIVSLNKALERWKSMSE
uniref:Uncharacterized protein n=1 Tax=Pseudomonas fluorescens (strain SBW25) TaxID=216595 RepID=A0A0G4E529_PSEFS|nr:hypothetical protein [Pseudomonas fluorescens]CEK42279.1 hypothetical protein PQBR57_0326 [Pseudomonas fluorescens SBW25]